mgnify:CR=1 FL=1
MKEKIEKYIIEAQQGNVGAMKCADWIIELVNQEVEKRIKERQLTDEQIERQFTTSHYHYEKGHYYKVRKDRIFGAKWYRDRLVSQKTEGGEG